MYGQRSAGPHALTRARVGGAVHRFHYDAQGHLEWDDAASGDDRFIEWDGRGLAVKVTVGTAKDAEKPKRGRRSRTARAGRATEDERVAGGRRSLGGDEVGDDPLRGRLREADAGVHPWRGGVRHGVDAIGGAHARGAGAAREEVRLRQHRESNDEIEYRHFDHLGSSASITDAAGSELVSLAHDPHGERRRPDWTRRLSEAETGALASDHPDRTSRGFTGTSIWTGRVLCT